MRHGRMVAERSIRSGSMVVTLLSTILAALSLLTACAFGSSASFTTQAQLGTEAHTLAIVEAKTGQVESFLPDPDLQGPTSVAPDRRGGWYVGGRFEHVANVPRTGVAHLRSDGSIDPSFVPDLPTGMYVSPILFHAGVVYVGDYGRGVYALDAKNGARLWHTPAGNSPVYGLAFGNKALFVCGTFRRIGGVRRDGIAALDPKSGKPTSWKVRLSEAGVPTVISLAVTNGSVYLGGAFNRVGGLKRDGLAAVNPRTGQPTKWAPRRVGAAKPLGEADSLLVTHGQALVGSVDGGFAAFDTRSARALSWTKRLKGDVWALASSGNTVYLGGAPDHGFTRAGGKSVNNLASAVLPKGRFTNWKPRLGRCTHVEAMAVSGGKVLIAGHFSPKAC